MLCIPTAAVPGVLSDKLAQIAAAGFTSIELSLADVIGFDGNPDEIGALVAANSLRVQVLGPLPGDLSQEMLSAKLEMAKAVGATILMLEVAVLPVVLSDALDDGMRIALYPNRAVEAEVVDFVTEINNPNIGLALNSNQVLGDGSRPARLRDLPADKILHVQLTDGPGAPLLPKQGTLNLAGFLRVIGRGGYQGAWSVAGPLQSHDSATNSFRALVNLLDEVAQTEPNINFDLPRLPPRVAATGVEFIEYAVDAGSAETLTNVLSSMAFRRERKHISKGVELWRQGAVNIVINQDPKGYAHTAFTNHGPTVCDMGMRVKDAKQTQIRATALGSHAFTQEVALGELSIPAIRGVGSSVVHFIDENSDLHRVWDIEFEPVSRTNATPPAGLRRIDHIAQTMNYNEMQSWLLYYISTFEMEKTGIVDVADPSGIIRSQAIASPDGELRLNLNGAEGHQTFASSFVDGGQGAGVQHLAFLTDDIFETAAVLEQNDFSRLHIPPNYFSETQSTFGLEDTQTAQLQEADILYDRDGTGEFFQLYSQPIFAGFFFEIVQRRGGYQGYGARNAPVRLAAQAKFRAHAGVPHK